MVNTKMILIAVASIAILVSAGVWFLISENRTAGARRAKFFEPSQTYPTTGGEKMKVEW